MEDFYSILKTKYELKVYSIPKKLYKKGRKWTAMKDLYLNRGLISATDIGY